MPYKAFYARSNAETAQTHTNLWVLCFMRLKDYFEPFLEYKKKGGCVDHTIGEYKRFLYGAISHCPVGEKRIKDLRLVDIVDVIEGGKSHGVWGSQRSLSVFRQLLKYLDDSGIKLPFNYVKIKLPRVFEKEQDFLTPQEFDDFVAKLPNDFYGLRDRAIYEVLWATGMRIGELFILNRGDIDFQNKEVKIKTEKSGDEGRVYFSDRSLDWLKTYLDTRKDDEPALFVIYNQGVRRLSKIQARKNLLNYRQKFGIIKKITHHAFRRSFCSLLLDRGATIKEVQVLARHRSERTTLKFYCKIEKTKAKQIHSEIFNGCG
jgi:integrase/recombinase XerD